MGLIIDSNLLLLYVVGACDRTLVGRHKRTSAFTEGDFDWITKHVEGASTLFVTPHILAEVSNLSAYGLSGSKLDVVRGALRDKCLPLLIEEHVPAVGVAGDEGFLRLGLTDAGIAGLAARGHTVLTDDLDLYLHLCSRGVEAVNFNHHRTELLDG